jgi:hypothetical protein
MTRLATPASAVKHLKPRPGFVWVRTRQEGADSYSVAVLGREQNPPEDNHSATCAYARLIMLDNGAVMAFFPLSAMVSTQAKALMGATSFELATPFVIPAFVFGFDIEIPAGRHPLVFILESWVVLFRPIITPGHCHSG